MAQTQGNSRWWILGALGSALGLFSLDETVVGVALPTIQHDLGLTIIQAHWVVNIYLLVLAGLTATSGRLCDLLGYKRIFTGGLAFFAATSVACGFAQDVVWILAARALQGVGAALIFPASMAMMAVIFPPEERGKAFGTTFMMLGPLVGGFLTETLSWRWIFWINPPVVLVAIVIVLVNWQDPPRETMKSRFDYGGLGSLIGGLGLVVFALMQGPDLGWSNPWVWITFVNGLLALGVFLLWEARRASPLIEVDLLKRPSFAAFNLMVFTGQFTKIAIIVIAALYFQQKLGMSPLIAGVALLASGIPQPLSAVLGGHISDRFGSRLPSLYSLSATAVVFLWIALAIQWENYWLIFPALVLWGVTNAQVFIPALRGGVNTVAQDKQGQVGGIMLTAQLLGGTVGMAICSALLASTGNFQLPFLATALLVLANLALVYFVVPDDRPRA